jgi:short-subunit dehydrogenase
MLSYKKIIIIGATSGIGKELAEIYLQQGCVVGITGRRKELLNEMQTKYATQIITACFDVRDEDALVHLKKLIEQLGGVDVFIYNAGVGEVSTWPSATIDIDTYEINVKGFMQLVPYIISYFMKQQRGHIAATSSVAGNRGNSWAPAYSASKAFISIYLEGLYMKVKKLKLPIHITDIQPGFVKTKMSQGNKQFWVATPQQAARQIYKAIEKKKWRVYITHRWKIIAFIMRIAPSWLYHKVA